MIIFPKPEPLFNPIIAPADQLLTGWEILAGPFGLLAFIPLVPVLRLAARSRPRTALITSGLVWMVATAGPLATLLVLAGCLAASGWVLLLAWLRRTGRVGPRLMLTLAWLGLSALAFPFWWYPQWSWYGWHEGSRLAVLHNAGLAYFLLRFIAWAVDLSREPRDPLRATDTICWLLYPPCMRLGPLLLRRQFLARLDAWDPSSPAPRKTVLQRFGLFVVGGVFLAVITRNLPHILPEGNFFSSPELYSVSKLVRVCYFIPIQVYLLLWIYNELACALSLWVGIRVDDNFDWLPRATSVRDFWQRWHVTVGRWLRIYIYTPVCETRRLVPLRFAAVFGFCAVWHGASWSFVAWGASQTVALMVQRAWDRVRKRLGWRNRPAGRWWTVLCWLVTMHYQIATILMFLDFEHCGWRVFRELARRLMSAGAG